MAEYKPDATWQELGMKPGIKVPGTSSWMAKWRKSPNQQHMIEYAQAVEELFKNMPAGMVSYYIKLYLSGKWVPKEEASIAAAIRRAPIIEGKYNLMEVERMSKKDKKETVVKKAEAEEKGLSLKDRVEALEKEVKKLNQRLDDRDDGLEEKFKELEDSDSAEKPSGPREKKKKEKEKKAGPVTADIEELLKQLEKAKENEDKKAAFKLRVKLRKAGYSLRTSGKK